MPFSTLQTPQPSLQPLPHLQMQTKVDLFLLSAKLIFCFSQAANLVQSYMNPFDFEQHDEWVSISHLYFLLGLCVLQPSIAPNKYQKLFIISRLVIHNCYFCAILYVIHAVNQTCEYDHQANNPYDGIVSLPSLIYFHYLDPNYYSCAKESDLQHKADYGPLYQF